MATANAADMSSGRDRSTNDLVDGFNNLNLIRQAGLMVGLAASVAIGFAVVLWTQGEDYRPLYGSLDRLDSSEVAQILDHNEIEFKIDGSTGALLVASDQIHKARLKLAEAGVPGEQSVGFELLDKEQPLGTSQFMEGTRYHRSLEGELARTITSINAVRSARVHLAIPKQSVFVRDARKPTASVFVELFAGRAIKPEQVKAMANLVASSIPELKIEDVTIVDQRGSLLSMGDENIELAMAGRQLTYTRKLEGDVVSRINSILAPIVGEGRFRAQVAAEVDFTQVEQADETFNPDLPAVRSEQTVDESQIGNATRGGIPGALSNQPPNDGAAPEQAGQAEAGGGAGQPRRDSKQATRNYELDRTLSYTKHQLGKVKRLTVAVVVDDKVVAAASGEERRAWTDNELERLSILVRDAVGFSAARGDSVNVLNSRFIGVEEPEIPVLEIWQEQWFFNLAKQLAGLIIVLVLIIGLLRPVLKNIAVTGQKAKELESAREMAALEEAGLSGFENLSDETVTLTGGDGLALPSPEESYEQQINIIKGLVAEDPGRVAQVIKRWVNEE